MNKTTDQNLIDFAAAIGELRKGQLTLETHFTNHLSDHWKDRCIGIFNGLFQIIIIIMLGLVFFK